MREEVIALTQQRARKLNDFFITDKAFYKQVLMIFIPVLLQSLINSGVNLMDNIMVGTLGEASISAVSLSNQFYGLYNIIVMGFAAQYVFAQFGFVFGFWKAWWIMVLIRFMIGSTASGTHNVSETLKKWRKKEND